MTGKDYKRESQRVQSLDKLHHLRHAKYKVLIQVFPPKGAIPRGDVPSPARVVRRLGSAFVEQCLCLAYIAIHLGSSFLGSGDWN